MISVIIRRIWYGVLIVFLLIPVSSQGVIVDRVVGVVDGEVITLSDLDEAFSRYGRAALYKETNPLTKEIQLNKVRKEVLELLIEEKLLLKMTAQSGIKVSDEEVDKAIEKLKEENKLTDIQMEQELTSQGFTLEGYRQYLKGSIRRSRIIESFIKPRISMEEGTIQQYFRDHAERYQRPPQIRVSQILIAIPPNANPKEVEKAKAKMGKALQQLKQGAEFGEVAARYSDDPSGRLGGDLGSFTKGEVRPELEEIIFTMDAGEVSDIMRSTQGLHIFKVIEKKDSKETLPYEETKERIMEDYYKTEVERLYTKWLEDLRGRFKVEVKL